MTFLNTNYSMQPNNAVLAQYKPLAKYIPAHGDIIIMSGIFRHHFAFVTDYNKQTNEVSMVIEGLPKLLLTMNEVDQQKKTKIVKLSDITTNVTGKWAVIKHEPKFNAIVWYV